MPGAPTPTLPREGGGEGVEPARESRVDKGGAVVPKQEPTPFEKFRDAVKKVVNTPKPPPESEKKRRAS